MLINKPHKLTQSGWGIVPAVGIAYSGYTTRSNSLAAIIPSILAVIVCSIQWFLIGYTLTYSEGGSVFGDFTYAFYRNVLSEPVGTVPAILFSFFQLVFQATVCAIAVGGACERGRILPLIPFIFVSVLTKRVLRDGQVLTQYLALVYIHIQSSRAHGLGRWFPPEPRRPRLRRRHTRARQQRRHMHGNERIPLVPSFP